MNPVVLLDEVDKLGSDYRGDPSSALLEVLDPAQNHTFRDHYLEVDLDLSKVLFIATANVAETIPTALLDRMEVIRLDGYTEDEKLAIARHHLLPRQLERAALRPDEVEVTDAALQAISADYTREAGVRSLERELGKLLRKVATKLAADAGTSETAPVVDRRAPTCADWLGRPKFFFEAADRTAVPGVATGLAVTGAGGDVLFVEATAMDGPRGPDHHRAARRRHEGVGGDRALLRAVARGRARNRAGPVQEPALPPSRAGRRRPEGRAVGGCHHDICARQPAHRRAGAIGRRHDG